MDYRQLVQMLQRLAPEQLQGLFQQFQPRPTPQPQQQQGYGGGYTTMSKSPMNGRGGIMGMVPSNPYIDQQGGMSSRAKSKQFDNRPINPNIAPLWQKFGRA